MKALKLRYNELTMQLTAGLVRALGGSVNSKTERVATAFPHIFAL